jgi:hypothetical protein
MSQYKSAIRTQQPPELSDNSKYRSQARQLQELFPTWSNDGSFFFFAKRGARLTFFHLKKTFNRS